MTMNTNITDYFIKGFESCKSISIEDFDGFDDELGQGNLEIIANEYRYKFYNDGIAIENKEQVLKVKYCNMVSIGVLTLPEIAAAIKNGGPEGFVYFYIGDKNKLKKIYMPFCIYSSFYDFVHKKFKLPAIPRGEICI